MYILNSFYDVLRFIHNYYYRATQNSPAVVPMVDVVAESITTETAITADGPYIASYIQKFKKFYASNYTMQSGDVEDCSVLLIIIIILLTVY